MPPCGIYAKIFNRKHTFLREILIEYGLEVIDSTFESSVFWYIQNHKQSQDVADNIIFFLKSRF